MSLKNTLELLYMVQSIFIVFIKQTVAAKNLIFDVFIKNRKKYKTSGVPNKQNTFITQTIKFMETVQL